MEKSRFAHSEEWVTEYVSDMSDGRYEYISGYVNLDTKALVKCTTCGELRSINMARFRWSKFHGKTVRCNSCYWREKERKAKEKVEAQLIAKERKEDARRIKACSGIQMQFIYCELCGAVMLGRKGTHWCEECRRRKENKYKDISRRVKIEKALVDSDITLDGLLRRDGCACHICGGLCDVNDFIKTDKAFIAGNNYPSIDHVIPLAKGGLHSWDNVKVAHRICNSLKGDSYDKAEMEKSYY